MILDYVHQEKQSGFIFTLMIISKYIVALIGGLILSCFSGIGDKAVFISAFYSPIAMTVIILLSKQKWEKPRELLSLKSFKWQFVIVAVLTVIGMLFAFGSVNSGLVDLLRSIGLKIPETVIPLGNTSSYIIACLTLCLLPAVIEELFFRGILLTKLKKFGEVKAIIISALAFALFHCSLSQLVYQFLYGLVFAYIVIKSGSVIVSMIIHFLNNFIVVSLTFFNVEIDYSNIFFILTGVAVLCLGLLLSFMLNRKRITERKGEYKRVSAFFLPFGVLGIGICILAMILGVIYV